MTTQILTFKNNLPNLTVLKLFSHDIDVVKAKLQQKLKQAPMMFIGMQVIIDLSAFDGANELLLDIDALLTFLQGEGINPVAIMTDRVSFRDRLLATGLGVLPLLQQVKERGTRVSNTSSDASARTEPTVAEAPTRPEAPRKTFDDPKHSNHKAVANQIIHHPVRSGQRLYSQGELTIVGSVSPGAEIIADGNIHVYGRLGGRAMAGAQGDENAAIFCQHLDAELVSIAGNYKQLEDISDDYRHQCVQISLENEKIVFSSL